MHWALVFHLPRKSGKDLWAPFLLVGLAALFTFLAQEVIEGVRRNRRRWSGHSGD